MVEQYDGSASARDVGRPAEGPAQRRRQPQVGLRVAWTISSGFVVLCVVFGLAVWPAVLLWETTSRATADARGLRPVLLGMAFVPIYLTFAFTLMVTSALATRLLRWRVPADTQTRISDYDWPLLIWVRQMVLSHVVRVFAGPVFRSSPPWTVYLRLSGARLGRGVFVNSMVVSDYHLLEFGDHVVVGGDAHVCGHTVERGILKTARIRLGDRTVVGASSVVGIGVETGEGCQIGALTVVPKYTKLAPGTSYVGVPLQQLQQLRRTGS